MSEPPCVMRVKTNGSTLHLKHAWGVLRRNGAELYFTCNRRGCCVVRYVRDDGNRFTVLRYEIEMVP